MANVGLLLLLFPLWGSQEGQWGFPGEWELGMGLGGKSRVSAAGLGLVSVSLLRPPSQRHRGVTAGALQVQILVLPPPVGPQAGPSLLWASVSPRTEGRWTRCFPLLVVYGIWP